MTLRHPGISPTNDLVAKKIFSNPEITCQFIRDMLDLPAKKCNHFGGKQHSRLAFLDMVRKHLLTAEVASEQLGMTVAEFEALL